MKERLSKIPGARVCAAVMVIYIFLVFAFHFLAGDQLLYRQSRENIELPVAQTGVAELTQDVVVEQVFSANIQRFETLGVQMATSYRPNFGTVTVELIRETDGAVLLSNQFDASKIEEGQILTLTAAEPMENVCGIPLKIRLTADSVAGSAIIPLMNTEMQDVGELYVNGQSVAGTLCFIASGEEYIWTGVHYWKFALLGGILLAVFLAREVQGYKNGKYSFVLATYFAVKKYKFLIKQLVSRDFKTKYKRSVLGVFWSFLNPLLTMIVQYFVFSTIFKTDIQHYTAYLLIGIVCFNFFSEACGMTLTSILGNASLITKVYMPKYIYPVTRVMSSMINLGISLIPLIIVSLATGVHFTKAAILAFFFLGCLVIFSMGLGLLLCTSMVFFRDTQFLWGVFSMIWMYATPIFYPESILPDNFRFVLTINPLYYFLKNTRLCILDGISPEPVVYVQCFLIAVAMLFVGAWVFRKNQDKFVLYL